MSAALAVAPPALRPRRIGFRYWLGLWAVDAVSLLVFVVRRLRATPPDVRILVYHDVIAARPADDPYRMTVPPALFDRHMAFLRRAGYHCVTVAQALDLLQRDAVPGRSVVVTFDDGYVSMLSAAAPVLARHAVPATLFVAAGHVGAPAFAWNGAAGPFTRPLRWDELHALRDQITLEIGSHTVTHRPLQELDPAEQDHELALSRGELETRLGQPVRVFAYPFGGWDTFPDDVRGRVRAQGYAAACANVMGANTAATDRFALRRVRIGWNDTLWRFRLKLAGAYDWSDRLRRVLAGRSEKV